MDLMWIPVVRSWRLNERHYGALQGLNKSETVDKHGAEQVLIWRRSYSIQPPALEEGDERLPDNDPRYTHLAKEDLPRTEALNDTVKRFLPAKDRSLERYGETLPALLVRGNRSGIKRAKESFDLRPRQQPARSRQTPRWNQ
jgi:bisphosphoglycerate-dependent phosphoglycerate mutase family 1